MSVNITNILDHIKFCIALREKDLAEVHISVDLYEIKSG